MLKLLKQHHSLLKTEDGRWGIGSDLTAELNRPDARPFIGEGQESTKHSIFFHSSKYHTSGEVGDPFPL